MSIPKPPRKPPAGSRSTTARPKRVAGATPKPGVVEPAEPVSLRKPAPALPVEPAPVELVETTEPDSTSVEPVETTPDEPVATTSRRTTSVLVGVIVLLLVLGAWEVVRITGHEAPQDRAVGRVSETQPVQLDELTVRSVVDQAAQVAIAIGSTSWQDYAAGVDRDAAMMTDPFAEKYRTTKADVKPQVQAQKVDVVVDVAAQGVVSATPSRVVALLFLTQQTTSSTGPVTPRQYRATVTMVKTPDGWLAEDLDAGDLLDITGDAG
ncbi:hypothetical protein BH11ACT8_BH11ACT8_05750 [soil metagenome]